jgi:hypothetical protein
MVAFDESTLRICRVGENGNAVRFEMATPSNLDVPHAILAEER